MEALNPGGGENHGSTEEVPDELQEQEVRICGDPHWSLSRATSSRWSGFVSQSPEANTWNAHRTNRTGRAPRCCAFVCHYADSATLLRASLPGECSEVEVAAEEGKEFFAFDCVGEGLLLDGDVRADVDGGGAGTGVSEPESDHGGVYASLEQGHRTGVAQGRA